MTTITNRETELHKTAMTAPGQSLGLYIHIPFCVRKCRYCDFLSFGGVEDEVQNAYFRSLQSEIHETAKIYGNKYYVDSVFIGGGTPSMVNENWITELMTAVQDRFPIAKNAEISIESNPKTLTEKKLTAYLSAGINRLSIGVQSLDDNLLRYMGRVHTGEDFLKNYEMARQCGFRNINIDLMFAIPGQTAEIWKNTLKSALRLEPEHISFYSLQIEEDTPFYLMLQDGSLKQTEDVLDRKMYHCAVNMLSAGGYIHYEISNAAKKGYPCRHNLKYWSMDDYLGLGLGAHSFINGTRSSNITELADYNRAEGSHNARRHQNTKNENISEYLFTGMRKIAGINLKDFEDRFSVDLKSLYGNVLEKYRLEGLIEIEEDFLRFTKAGIDISNRVLAEFV